MTITPADVTTPVTVSKRSCYVYEIWRSSGLSWHYRDVLGEILVETGVNCCRAVHGDIQSAEIFSILQDIELGRTVLAPSR